ncbi:dynein regulatory complex protein 1 isoform X2 [Tachypleus tridentatus]|uniref:dynein regulatory complex protein 1 isoform X2 n=1 Tax=Tachypleus tridentatus TaxID=6853 RepID=UPI003FD38B6E
MKEPNCQFEVEGKASISHTSSPSKILDLNIILFLCVYLKKVKRFLFTRTSLNYSLSFNIRTTSKTGSNSNTVLVSMLANNVDKSNSVFSIESKLREQRILARRYKSTRKMGSHNDQSVGDEEDSTGPSQPSHNKNTSEGQKQLQESDQDMRKLLEDGLDLVTNVQVAAVSRETLAQQQNDAAMSVRCKKIQKEAETTEEKYKMLLEKWENAAEMKTAHGLRQKMHILNNACSDLLHQKNQIISELQDELRLKDEDYVQTLKKHVEDISTIRERINQLVTDLSHASKQELKYIEDAFQKDEQKLMTEHTRNWETFLNNTVEQEGKYLIAREKQVEESGHELHQMYFIETEDYNLYKQKLENDVHVLQQHLQQIKVVYLLNQEKLEYNYQVLKKRDEENSIMKSEQKRRITKLHDQYIEVRAKLEKLEKARQEENCHLTEEYCDLVSQLQQLNKKTRHFQSVERRKYNEVWNLKDTEIKELLKKILTADCLIHEQLLGLPWEPPDLKFLCPEQESLQKNSERSETSALDLIQNLFDCTSESVSEMCSDNLAPVSQDTAQRHVSYSDVRDVLELLCQEMQFLLDQKVEKLTDPLDDKEKLLMALDAIFNVLGIKTEEDVFSLVSQFRTLTPETSEKNYLKNLKTKDVLLAVRNYMADVSSRSSVHPVLKKKKPVSDPVCDAIYWNKFLNVISETRQHLWEALQQGLDSAILTQRANLVHKVLSLKYQNQELKSLLEYQNKS